MSAKVRPCPLCGKQVSGMMWHAVREHTEFVKRHEHDIPYLARALNLAPPTVKGVLGEWHTMTRGTIICPRCNREVESKAKHFLEYQYQEIVMARAMGLTYRQIRNWLFNGFISVEHLRGIIKIEEEELQDAKEIVSEYGPFVVVLPSPSGITIAKDGMMGYGLICTVHAAGALALLFNKEEDDDDELD